MVKKKTKRRTLLPRLRKISYKNKKHKYRLKDPFTKRKKAIHEGVKMESKMKGRTTKKAAIAKKGRFNVLRIYRKNKKVKECKIITHDMRYMDKKYGLGKTRNICGQKGGTKQKKQKELNQAQKIAAVVAAQGKNAELIAKGSLAKAGLRTRSKKDVITGKRIPGSSSNRFLQLIGQEKKEDAENTIIEAEKASSKKKGMIFVFNLLLQTLEEIKRLWDEGRRNYDLNRLIEELNLEEKESRLLYIIVYSSALTDDDAPPDMRNLLQRIKRDFGFHADASYLRDPTNISEMYYIRTHGLPYDHLLKRIQAVNSYIAFWKEKVDTAKRTVLDEVVKTTAAARKSEYGPPMDPHIAPYDSLKGVVGPYAGIADYLPDTEKHKQQVIDKRERMRAEKFRRAYEAERREAAIQRERLTPEQAKNLPHDYGRALNAGGGRRRKKKTRKRRKGGRKKTRRKRKTKRKRKTRRKKGGGDFYMVAIGNPPTKYWVQKQNEDGDIKVRDYPYLLYEYKEIKTGEDLKPIKLLEVNLVDGKIQHTLIDIAAEPKN